MKPYSFFNASIETFLLAAKHRSFRKTAETLGVSAPAVSRAMKHLEEELGFELFVRERPLSLTSEGERLKAILEGAGGPIAKEIEALRNTSFVKPSVSIGLPESFNLLHGRELIEILKPYCSHIQLVSSGSSDVLTEQMNAGQLDMILAPDNHQLLGTIKKIPIAKQSPLIIFPKEKAPPLPQPPQPVEAVESHKRSQSPPQIPHAEKAPPKARGLKDLHFLPPAKAGRRRQELGAGEYRSSGCVS